MHVWKDRGGLLRRAVLVFCLVLVLLAITGALLTRTDSPLGKIFLSAIVLLLALYLLVYWVCHALELSRWKRIQETSRTVASRADDLITHPDFYAVLGPGTTRRVEQMRRNSEVLATGGGFSQVEPMGLTSGQARRLNGGQDQVKRLANLQNAMLRESLDEPHRFVTSDSGAPLALRPSLTNLWSATQAWEAAIEESPNWLVGADEPPQATAGIADSLGFLGLLAGLLAAGGTALAVSGLVSFDVSDEPIRLVVDEVSLGAEGLPDLNIAAPEGLNLEVGADSPIELSPVSVEGVVSLDGVGGGSGIPSSVAVDLYQSIIDSDTLSAEQKLQVVTFLGSDDVCLGFYDLLLRLADSGHEVPPTFSESFFWKQAIETCGDAEWIVMELRTK
ncbi:MAG: hypothetical protein AAGA65_27790 [Actinomycetota bacterium]